MKRRLLYLFFALFFSLGLCYSQTLQRYEYWIDANYASKVSVNNTKEDIEITVPLSSYAEGVHFFNFRCIDIEGTWGAPSRYLFYKPDATEISTTAVMESYEYWMDDESKTRKHVTSSSEDVNVVIPLSSYAEGVHFFNFRSRNSDGVLSSVNRYLFYKPDATEISTTAVMESYEYWMDSESKTRKHVTSSSEDVNVVIPLSSYAEGVHFFNFRSRNTDGVWSSVNRYLFYKPDATEISTTAVMESYEYWMDSESKTRKHVTSSSEDVNVVIPLSSYAEGVHFFNFRSRNTDGVWSSVNRYLFYKPDATEISTTAFMESYEYWMDDESKTRKHVTSSSEDVNVVIPLSSYAEGVHFFNFRSRNSDGVWSSINRYLFYKPGASDIDFSKIVGYSYGFNGNMKYEPMEPCTEYELNRVFDIPEKSEMVPSETVWEIKSGLDSIKLTAAYDYSFSISFKNENDLISIPINKNFTINDTICHKAGILGVQNKIDLQKAEKGDFLAFKSTITESMVYYLRMSQNCSVTIYDKAGKLIKDIQSAEKNKTYSMILTPNDYYGVVENTVINANNPDSQIQLRLMITDNCVPTPEISFYEGKVSISCAQEGSTLYYTTDGSTPTASSIVYSEPFDMPHNATIKVLGVYEDLNNSDIASYKINSYTTQDPIIQFTNLKLYLSCPTLGSEIYYTIDGSDPITFGIKYSEPIALSSNCVAKAVSKKTDFNNSAVVSQSIDLTDVTCVSPTFYRNGTKLSLSSLTEGTTIYYTIDGTIPTTNSLKYSGEIEITKNCTITAMATSDGHLNSVVATYQYNWFTVSNPTYTFEDGVLNIKCETDSSTIFYKIGNENFVEYKSEIFLSDNKPVLIYSTRDGYNNSDSVSFTPDYYTCSTPEIEFDGKSFSIKVGTEYDELYYSTDGTNPTKNSSFYDGNSVKLNSICDIKAIAYRDYYNASSVASYTIPSLYCEGSIYIREPGSIAKAFEWNETEENEYLTVTGSINDADISLLMSSSYIKYLDISNVTLTNNALSDSLFNGSDLFYVSLPSDISAVGNGVFNNCNNLSAINWKADISLSESALGNLSNPNLLIYTSMKEYAPNSIHNVIVNSFSDSIVLSDGSGNNNFYCPISFTAGKVRYKHTYQMETIPGEASGWETISLPFDVQTITHSEKGKIVPFSNYDNSYKPFWLYSLSESGFVPASDICSNTPYLISMPNNEMYASEYNLNGDVTFSAENATVCATMSLNKNSKGSIEFVPNYYLLQKSDLYYSLNINQEYNGDYPGSIFVQNLRSVRPFEAYILNHSYSSNTIFRIKDINTGVEQLFNGLNDSYSYIVGKNSVTILAEDDVVISIYNMHGQLIQLISLNCGEQQTIFLKPSIYMIGKNKVLVP